MIDIPALRRIARLARAGEALSDVDVFELARAADGVADLPGLDGVRALLAPGRRDGGFYLDDAFAEPLHGARAAYARAEAELDARRAAVALQLRALCGIDITGEEFIVMRDRYDGPLPDDVVLIRETDDHRAAVIRVDAAGRDAALETLARAEREARRALGDAIARLVSERPEAV